MEERGYKRNQSVKLNRDNDNTDNSFITEHDKDLSFNIDNSNNKHKRSLSFNINNDKDDKDLSFNIDTNDNKDDKDLSFDLDHNGGKEDSYIKKNLYKQFNRCESIKSNKAKNDKAANKDKDKNPLVLTFKLNSNDDIRKLSGKIDNWNITSNHVSNKKSKQNSPNVHFIQKTQFTFNNSNGSREMNNLRSINSDSVYKDFAIKEEISGFNTTNGNSSCGDNGFKDKLSQFKETNNNNSENNRNKDKDNIARSIEETKEDYIGKCKEKDKEKCKGDVEGNDNSTPQFSTNKEAYGEILSYQDIYKTETLSGNKRRKKSASSQKLKSNKKFKEDDDKLTERMEVGKLNSDQKKTVFMKRKKSEEEKINLKDSENFFSSKNNNDFSLKNFNGNDNREETYNESQDITIGDSSTYNGNKDSSVHYFTERYNELKIEDSLIQKSPDFSRTENILIENKEELCSLDFENIKNIINFYKKDLSCSEESRTEKSRKSEELKKISQSKIISFSNMEEPEKESIYKEEKTLNIKIEEEDVNEETNESCFAKKSENEEEIFYRENKEREKEDKNFNVIISSSENITTSGQKRRPVFLNTKDSFAESRIKDMLLSHTNTSDSNKKPAKQKNCETTFKTKSISFIKELSEEESKNVLTSKESIINKRNSHVNKRKTSLQDSIAFIKESSVKSDLSENKPKYKEKPSYNKTDEDKEDSHYHSFGSKNKTNSIDHIGEEQKDYIVSLKIPLNEKSNINKNITSQTFNIISQSNRNNPNNFSKEFQEHKEESLEITSSVKKRKKSTFYPKDETEEQNEQERPIDSQNNTLKEVVNKINMLSSELSDIKNNLQKSKAKKENNTDIAHTIFKRASKKNKEGFRKSNRLNCRTKEILKSLYEEDDYNKDNRMNYRYSSKNNIVNMNRTVKDNEDDSGLLFNEKINNTIITNKSSFVYKDDKDILAKKPKSTKRRQKLENIIETREYKPRTSERKNPKKAFTPMTRKSNKKVFFKDSGKENKLKELVSRQTKKDNTAQKKRKKSSRISFNYSNIENKPSTIQKSRSRKSNYFKLYMKNKNLKNESSIAKFNKTPRKQNRPLDGENDMYPCIVDKQILKIKRSEVIIERKYVSNKKIENEVSIHRSGFKNRYKGYSRDLSYHDLSSKKEMLVKKIEELEKSFDVYE